MQASDKVNLCHNPQCTASDKILIWWKTALMAATKNLVKMSQRHFFYVLLQIKVINVQLN